MKSFFVNLFISNLVESVTTSACLINIGEYNALKLSLTFSISFEEINVCIKLCLS